MTARERRLVQRLAWIAIASTYVHHHPLLAGNVARASLGDVARLGVALGAVSVGEVESYLEGARRARAAAPIDFLAARARILARRRAEHGREV